MATLTVWKFDTPGGAEDAAEVLKDLAQQEIITIHERPPAELIFTNLSDDQETAIRDVFAH